MRRRGGDAIVATIGSGAQKGGGSSAPGRRRRSSPPLRIRRTFRLAALCNQRRRRPRLRPGILRRTWRGCGACLFIDTCRACWRTILHKMAPRPSRKGDPSEISRQYFSVPLSRSLRRNAEQQGAVAAPACRRVQPLVPVRCRQCGVLTGGSRRLAPPRPSNAIAWPDCDAISPLSLSLPPVNALASFASSSRAGRTLAEESGRSARRFRPLIGLDAPLIPDAVTPALSPAAGARSRSPQPAAAAARPQRLQGPPSFGRARLSARGVAGCGGQTRWGSNLAVA